MDSLGFSALILSGGNSLAYLNEEAVDAAPERDRFEIILIDLARRRKLPVLGVCRGMQLINHYFKGDIVPVRGHAARHHELQFDEGYTIRSRNVNSFHDWGMTEAGLGRGLRCLARHADGTVEALRHEKEKMAGIMWHPEREPELHPQDRHLLTAFLA
jgi:putative glutamine amidotransferase